MPHHAPAAIRPDRNPRRFRKKARAALAAAGIAAAVLLVACGGGSSSSDPAPSADPDPAPATVPEATVPEANGTEPTDEEAAIRPEEFGTTDEKLVANIEAVETLVAGCMNDQGFEYVPVAATTVREAMDAFGTRPGLSDEEYIAQFGFGITTELDAPSRAKVFGDSNIRVYDDLPPADQVAYDRALLGEDVTATFVLTLEEENFTPIGGCTRQAVEATFTAEQISVAYVNPFDALVNTDPRYISASEQWAECMREEGFTYAGPDDPENELREQLAVITGGADPTTLTGAALDALTALQGEERAIALLAEDCQEEFLADVEDMIEEELTGSS